MNETEALPVRDGNLIVRHRQGDETAFAELVAEYRAPVYSYLVRFGIASETRDDLFQDIFLKIHRAAGRYRTDRPLQPWLFTIVANTVRNHLRARRVRELVHAPAKPTQDPVSEEADGERVAAARQTLAWLEGQLDTLPISQREALQLCCVQEIPQIEVASILGVPVNTLKTRLRRGRLALARAMARRKGEETS